MEESESEIVKNLRDEADLCRNETATDVADLLDDAASCIVAMASQFNALKAERDRLKAHAEALENIETSLRRAGATLPAPEPTGTIEGAMNAGLCIALCVVVAERERAMGAAVFGGGHPEATSGNTTTHSGESLQATHSQECPDHEQKQPQPANPKDAP